MKHLKDKVAVITGAGSGIGRALAQQLAKEGAQLALSDINIAGLDETISSLPKNIKVKGYQVDVSSEEAVFANAEQIRADFGTVHLLFNNAGTTLVGLFDNLSLDEIRWIVDINLWGVLYSTKAFLPTMLEQREGCIVNVSSVLGLVGFPANSAYAITKFGVRGLTESLWCELAGTGVEAVCVHPGGINTGFDSRVRFASKAGEFERATQNKVSGQMRTTPDECAAEILQGIRKGHRRIVVGRFSSVLFWLPRLLPESYHGVLKLLA